MLIVEGINSFYGASHVLHGVGLEARSGELVALLGRNGAGKTTTLSSLMGTVRVGSGKVWLDGEDITALPSYRKLRKGLALVPSGARVFADLSVEENLSVVRPRSVAAGTVGPSTESMSRSLNSVTCAPARPATSPVVSARCSPWVGV